MDPVVEAVTEPVTLGEGPHWDHAEQALYFVSILDHTVHKYVPATGAHTTSKVEGNASFIIPIEGKQNHFVVGNKRNVTEIEWSGENDGARVVGTVAEVDSDKPNNSLNDGKADPRGRLFAGTLDYGETLGNFVLKAGALYRIDQDGSTHKLDEGIDVSNGMCWDLEEKAFYFIDTLEYDIRRYDYDLETGTISNARQIFNYKEQGVEGLADGMTIDTDGNLWVANFNGHEVIKIDPKSGKLLQRLRIPVAQVTSVTFGGPSLDELYVTTGSMGDDQKPPSGSVFTVSNSGVKGHPNLNYIQNK